MAHFAELDSNNVVLRVVVIDNKDCCDVNGTEKESIGIAFCEKVFGGNWKQTSYNGTFRSFFAGIGFTYDSVRDRFVPPKPSNEASWIYHEEDNAWIRPVPQPEDWAYIPSQEALGKKSYVWDESANNWAVLQTVFT
jgi:hypothetical protein